MRQSDVRHTRQDENTSMGYVNTKYIKVLCAAPLRHPARRNRTVCHNLGDNAAHVLFA